MGEEKIKKSRNQRLLKIQPYCVYCGGTHKAEQVDHIPPTSMFDGRQRPKDPVVSVCRNCHEGTRKIDQYVSFASRMYPDPETFEQKKEAKTAIRSLLKNQPEIAKELEEPLPSNILNGLHVGAIQNQYLKYFAARITMAIYHCETGKIVLPGESVLVRAYSNHDAIIGNISESLKDFFGSSELKTLRQGKMSVQGQFDYNVVEAKDRFAVYASYRKSFAHVGFVSQHVADDFEFPENIIRPGFLKTLI